MQKSSNTACIIDLVVINRGSEVEISVAVNIKKQPLSNQIAAVISHRNVFVIGKFTS